MRYPDVETGFLISLIERPGHCSLGSFASGYMRYQVDALSQVTL